MININGMMGLSSFQVLCDEYYSTMRKDMKKILLAITISILGSAALGQANDPIVTESTSTVDSTSQTTVNSPPPTAASPSINSTNSDLCLTGTSGAVQTQILGVSGGSTTIDPTCERLKISKTLYDMGMKVAAVGVMCQDPRVFEAMINAGTPCPVNGMIGPEALAAWNEKPEMKPETIEGAIKRNEGSSKLLLPILAIVVAAALATN